jgi:hypothetical protein
MVEVICTQRLYPLQMYLSRSVSTGKASDRARAAGEIAAPPHCGPRKGLPWHAPRTCELFAQPIRPRPCRPRRAARASPTARGDGPQRVASAQRSSADARKHSQAVSRVSRTLVLGSRPARSPSDRTAVGQSSSREAVSGVQAPSGPGARCPDWLRSIWPLIFALQIDRSSSRARRRWSWPREGSVL